MLISTGILQEPLPTSKLYCTKPSHHIYYLKCPKTGSSTMANILHRLTASNDAIITTFKHCVKSTITSWEGELLVHPDDVNSNGTDREGQSTKYDICIRHSIYDQRNIDKYMKPDVKLIATIRNPYIRLRSHFYFFQAAKRFKIEDKPDPFDYYLQNPTKFESEYLNRIAREFGMDVLLASTNKTYLSENLGYIQKQFNHVVITHYYDESLILLKRIFCWSMKSIIYKPLFVKKYSETNETIRTIHYKESVKKLNFLDELLYNTFLQIHQQKVQNEGASLQEELEIFRGINARVAEFCDTICNTVEIPTDDIFIEVEKSKYNEAFKVGVSECLLLRLPITQFEPRLYFKQYQEICERTYNINLDQINLPLFQFCKRFEVLFKCKFPYYENVCVKNNVVNMPQLDGCG